jgi:hypothetical protein
MALESPTAPECGTRVLARRAARGWREACRRSRRQTSHGNPGRHQQADGEGDSSSNECMVRGCRKGGSLFFFGGPAGNFNFGSWRETRAGNAASVNPENVIRPCPCLRLLHYSFCEAHSRPPLPPATSAPRARAAPFPPHLPSLAQACSL